MLDQKGQCIVDRLGVNDMIVIKDEDEIFRGGCDLIDQGCQKRLGRWRPGKYLERTHHPFPDIRHNRPQSRDEASQKARGVAIPLVQRQPGGRRPHTATHSPSSVVLPNPAGGNERQAAMQTLVQTLGQAGAWHGFRPRRGDIELGR